MSLVRLQDNIKKKSTVFLNSYNKQLETELVQTFTRHNSINYLKLNLKNAV